MPGLRELQADVLDALFERPGRAGQHVLADGIAPDRRLDVYRHNMVASLSAALAAVYPTVAALVGDGFFRFAAHRYLLAHPSRSGNLHEFGGELAAFLARFEPAASLPYLSDCARLDWAWHAVFHTAAEPARATHDLLAPIGALPAEKRPGVRLRWQPAARVVGSRYPILRIWQLHHETAADARGDAPPIDLDAGGESVLVLQRAGDVVLWPLAPAEHALLEALARHATLGESVGAALLADDGFDVAGAIAHHVALGTLVGMELPR